MVPPKRRRGERRAAFYSWAPVPPPLDELGQVGYPLALMSDDHDDRFNQNLGPLAKAWRALYWTIRTGSWEWLCRKLGIADLFWRQPTGPGRIEMPAPMFLREHARALHDPPVMPATRARHMRDDDMIVGVSINGEARAYPWWIMDNHHVANDVLGGQPITVMLCEMCSTAMVFDPRVRGRRLRFTQRHYYNGTLALDDLETGSVWASYTGQAVRGKLRGEKIELLPASQMTWAAWRELHPDTTVLVGASELREGHGSGQVIGGAGVGPDFRRTIGRWDQRLPHNTLVLGVSAGHAARAYRLEDLRERLVVNDEVGGEPIVIFFHPAEGSYAALAYSRTVEGRTLTFEHDGERPVDRETGSRWNLEGRAVSGPLAGTVLRFVPSHVSEWYVWGANYPGIEIFGHPFGVSDRAAGAQARRMSGSG